MRLRAEHPIQAFLCVHVSVVPSLAAQLGQYLVLCKGLAMHLSSTDIFLLRSSISSTPLKPTISVEQCWLQSPAASAVEHLLM